MISLPPGCSLSSEITVVIDNPCHKFFIWWEEIGGTIEAVTIREEPYKPPIIMPRLRYNNGPSSYYTPQEPNRYLIRFRSEDADAALMMILKWDKLVINHNFQKK